MFEECVVPDPSHVLVKVIKVELNAYPNPNYVTSCANSKPALGIDLEGNLAIPIDTERHSAGTKWNGMPDMEMGAVVAIEDVVASDPC